MLHNSTYLPWGDRRARQTALENVRPQRVAQQRQIATVAESVNGHPIQIDIVRAGR